MFYAAVATAMEEKNEAIFAMLTSMIIRFLRERRIYWNIVHELSNYSDRELTDIGIARVDIRDIARLAAKDRLREG